MTQLLNDEQLKAHYTQKELVDLVRRKASIANRNSLLVSNTGYRRYSKEILIMMIRELDKVMKDMPCKHERNETVPVGGGETITVCHDCGDEL